MMQEPIQSQPEALNITKKMTTGEVTEKFPVTKAVFAKYFGRSCFFVDELIKVARNKKSLRGIV